MDRTDLTYEDAITVLRELLALHKEERDAYGPEVRGPLTGLYKNWDMYHKVNDDVKALERALFHLTSDTNAANLLSAAHDRAERATME